MIVSSKEIQNSLANPFLKNAAKGGTKTAMMIKIISHTADMLTELLKERPFHCKVYRVLLYIFKKARIKDPTVIRY